MTWDVFGMTETLNQEAGGLAKQFFADFWYLLIIWLILTWICWLCSRLLIIKKSSDKSKLKYYFAFPVYLIIIGLTVIGIRGTIGLRPMAIITASKYAPSNHTPLVLNSTYCMLRTIGKTGILETHYFTDERLLDATFTPRQQYSDIKTKSQKNVVLIIVESLSAEHCGFLNPGKQSYTPFLDSLANSSLVCTNAYANAKRSIEGVPAIISSLPSLMHASWITSIYNSNCINSAPALLKSQSYHTAFFHGGQNGTLGLTDYASVAGFDQYFGQSEYPNPKDFDGRWGIFDEPFLQFMHTELKNMPQPFFSAVFTLSSHHPYTIPPQYKGKFKKGSLEIQEVIMYADYALQKFFASCRNEEWFANTLFVITADHASEPYDNYYKTPAGSMRIPIIYYAPSDTTLRGISKAVSQQCDIMPSILHYMGYQGRFTAFGHSIFSQVLPHFACWFNDGIYNLVRDSFYIQFDGDNLTAVYNLKTDSLQQNNLKESGENAREISNDKLFIMAIIQQFNNRMIHNTLCHD